MPDDRPRSGVGYVLRKFPVLSETFVLNEMLALEERGVPLHIFSLERPNDPRFHEGLSRLKARVAYVPDMFQVARLREHGSRLRKVHEKGYYEALAYAMRRGNPTLVWRFLQACYVANEAHRLKLGHLHAHFANRAATVAFLASKMTGISHSFTAHAMDIFKEKVSARTLARKIHEARFVVTVSDFNKRFLEERANGDTAKIVRIYNGIDLERFTSNGVPPSSPFVILTVARLVEKKGLHILIQACRDLRDRGIAFRCQIAGKGRARPQLESLIKTWKLQDHIQLLGPRTQGEVLELYRSAHVYVLPCIIGADGNRDGLPVSIVEALACGLPVVTTPVTGIPEAVVHEHNGLLVPSGDVGALANALESLVRDAHLYETLRSNARPSVTSTFDLRQSTANLQRWFQGAEA